MEIGQKQVVCTKHEHTTKLNNQVSFYHNVGAEKSTGAQLYTECNCSPRMTWVNISNAAAGLKAGIS